MTKPPCLFRILLIVLFLILALPNPYVKAQARTHPSFADLAKRAQEARNNSQFEQAVIQYRAALNLRQSWVEGWWDLGSIEYKLRHYSVARESFRRVTILNPKSGGAFAFMGLCDYELARYISALKNLDAGGKLGFGANKDLAPLVLYRVALLVNREGDFERSLDQLALFVAAGNHDPEIVEGLGLSTLRMPHVPSEIPANKHDLVMKAGEAAWAFDSHNVEGAKKQYQGLAEAYPREPNVHYAYATYLLDSDPQLALEEFKKELEINPSNNSARLQLAFFDLQQGSPEQAMKLARESLRVASHDYRVHLLIGRSLLQMDQPANALPELKMSAALAPEDYETRLYLAQTYRNLGNKEAASREQANFDRLKQTEKRETSTAGWWYFAGQYYEKRRFHEARDAFHKVTDQDPKDGAALAMTGFCDFQLADYKSALGHLTRATQIGIPGAPEVESSTHYYLGLLLNQAGEFDSALSQLSWFATKAQVSQQIIEAIGINALRMKVLPADIQPDKHDLVIKAGEAAWAFNIGRLDEAKRLFAGLTATYPNEPNVHYGYGLCLFQSNDPDDAVREFQRELDITPSHGDAEAHIVLMHLKQGLREDALREARSAVEMAPDSFLTHNALGWALLATRQFDSSVVEMKTSVRLAPDTPATHYSLAQAYKADGKDIDAQKELARFESLTKSRKSASVQSSPQ